MMHRLPTMIMLVSMKIATSILVSWKTIMMLMAIR